MRFAIVPFDTMSSYSIVKEISESDRTRRNKLESKLQGEYTTRRRGKERKKKMEGEKREEPRTGGLHTRAPLDVHVKRELNFNFHSGRP